MRCATLQASLSRVIPARGPRGTADHGYVRICILILLQFHDFDLAHVPLRRDIENHASRSANSSEDVPQPPTPFLISHAPLIKRARVFSSTTTNHHQYVPSINYGTHFCRL